MKESDSVIEIVREPGAVSLIFEKMQDQRKPLSIVQHGHSSDAWVVKVSPSQLILAKRDKALKFTTEAVEFQFRCVLGRNITGKSRIIRLKDDFLELALPPEVAIIQRREAYRVVPTIDSVAIFQTVKKRILSGRIEDLSSTGILVRIPQEIPIAVPCDIRALCLYLNHAESASDFTRQGTVKNFMVTIKTAIMTIVRKADNGATKFATYGIHFTPSALEERQLSRIIVGYERAARQKGLRA